MIPLTGLDLKVHNERIWIFFMVYLFFLVGGEGEERSGGSRETKT